MNNQQQGSRTSMVRQNAPVFLASDTIHPSSTLGQTPSTTRFLEMGRAALRGELVNADHAQPPPSKHFQQTRGPIPVAPPSVLTPDQGENRVATLPEITERRAKSKAHHRAA
ncbi:hypothetical protein, partial [Deinococcus marmoris]|uniref:hypothetical protein n=1 Tax=Deinococcus marmoris TaxID=249408 RepID=UPI0039EE76CF